MNIRSASGATPEHKTVHNLISERDAEITRLEREMLKMDYEADQDISQHWDCMSRSLRPTRSRKEVWMSDTNDYVVVRTTRLLEEQEPVQQKLLTLRRANQLSRATVASVRKIPNEVLSLIFQNYVDMDFSVWDLVDVCEQWKHVAFALPHLWSTIRITRISDHREDKRYHYRRSHLCDDPSRLKTILDRCGSVSLDVTIECYGDQDYVGGILACLKILNNSNVISRVKSLEINMGSPKVMEAWPECFLFASFTRLERIKLGSYISPSWYENIIRAISATSKRLQDFRSNYPGPSIAFPDHIWYSIKALELHYTIPPNCMDEVATKCSRLEELICNAYHWPNLNSPRINFPNLSNASFSCSAPSLRLLHLPVIQNLCISEYFRDRSIPSNPALDFMAFPELKKLSIRSSNLEQWFTNVSMDTLEDLKLVVFEGSLSPSILEGTSFGTFNVFWTFYPVSLHSCLLHLLIVPLGNMV
ncbi:hypothetical protein CPB86DRAFT_563116 [Serendipita vermifera]|nr:hypothetical protein CPB86DRAFT_563116 [Serendipita vermifera]